MEIRSSSVVNFPVERVYQAYRDELPEIAAFMPNIKEVKTLERTSEGGRTRLHNVWAGKGEVPKVAQSILKPDMVMWDDYADWNDAERYCDWRIATRFFTQNVRCQGRNAILPEGPHRTRIQLSGRLEIDLRDIPGVPKFLAGSLAGPIERFIVAMITPNLEQTNAALERYLLSQQA